MNSEDIKHGMLTGIFGGKPVAPSEMFTHPHEIPLLTKIIEVLRKSETGTHLIDVLDAKKIRVRVIKHRNAHGYTPDNKMIYLGAPADMEEPDEQVVLEFGAAIREIEQEMVGFTMPDEKSDPLMAASVKHSKILDIIAFMCKIAIELEAEIEPASYVETIENLGYGEALQMYVSMVDDPKIIEAYKRVRQDVS